MTDSRNSSITCGVAFSNEIEYLLQTHFAVVDRDFDQTSDVEVNTNMSPSVAGVDTRKPVHIVQQKRSEQPTWTAVHKMARHDSKPAAQHCWTDTKSPEVHSRFLFPAINNNQHCEVLSKSKLFRRMGKALGALLLKSRSKKQQPRYVFQTHRDLDQDSRGTNLGAQTTPQLLPELAPNLVRTHSQNMRKGVARHQQKPPKNPDPYGTFSYTPDTQDLFLHRIRQHTQTNGYMSKDGSLIFDSPEGYQARLTRFVGLSQESLPHLDPNLFNDFDWGPERVARPTSSSSLELTTSRTTEFSVQAMHCASAQNAVALIDDQRFAAEAFLEMEFQQGGLMGCMRKKRLEKTVLNNYVYQMYSTNTKNSVAPKLHQQLALRRGP